ncbi:uncharacterized protein LOC127262786 isoform X2 [Andrographis paniculata]|uniref:uncharacterized protein LOC127262786 isoform X2 n=1 Tax=Andrographis paniculata TaxID=175694 RepID=UPI0021E70652|nr:uncharacterized protein LOC127262786 isoform X2 [Andrographis paniculata]
MRSFLRATWQRLRSLMKNQTSLRDKAIAVAERVTLTKDEESPTISCPICSKIIQDQGNSQDLKMALAVHLSLWHPGEVMQQWDTMQKKNGSYFHFPTIIIGVGVAVVFGALVSISVRNHAHAQRLPPA